MKMEVTNFTFAPRLLCTAHHTPTLFAASHILLSLWIATKPLSRFLGPDRDWKLRQDRPCFRNPFENHLCVILVVYEEASQLVA